jgi:SAM-dependent methyltransferase
MIERLKRILEREKIKHPGKGSISLLKGRVSEIMKGKFDALKMSLKKDSTFTSEDSLFMCSLFPRKVLDLVIHELHARSVLDVGCGIGNSLQYFLKNGIDAWGVENSKVAILHSPVRERIIKHNLKKN